MMVLTSRTRVRGGDGARLTAQCSACDLELVLCADADVVAALSALDAAHPPRPHRRPHAAPAGWSVPLSALGAWSQ